MLIRLVRQQPEGEWLRGRLYVASDNKMVYLCDTIERTSTAILPLWYSVSVTMSPRFNRLLPIVNSVPQRSGIRIHVGTRPEHSSGCILVPNREIEEQLTQLLLRAQTEGEEIRMDVNVNEDVNTKN